MKIFLLLGLVAFAASRPQDVGVDDILGAADSARYGNSEEPADPSLIDDVFGGGGGNVDVSPIKDGGSYAGDGGDSHVNEIVDTSYEDCSYYADQGYKCVPYYTCEDGEIVTDGGGLIDIRSSFSAILDPGSSKCPGYLEVCCRHPEFATNAPHIETTQKPTTPKPRIYQSACGRRNIGGIGVRIQNDKYKGSTQFGEWPHMCAVLESKSVAGSEEVNLYVCGASLIAPGVILTGAHCVAKIKPSNIKIRCGEWDTQQQVEPRPHQDRYVQHVKIHPLFDPKNLHNDFAILFLESDFILAPHIDTICLPDNLAGIHDYNHKDCFATGWGKDKFGKSGVYQVIMKQVQMDIVDSAECQNRLRKTRLGDSFELDKSFICAGGEKDKDTCKGDGGGPLVCPKGDGSSYGGEPTYVQAGIIAWGIDCGVNGNPGVYANVADGLCFIDWATQCATGIPNYFNIQGCENWASSEIQSLYSKIEEFQKKLETITADGSGTPSNLRNLNRRIAKHNMILKIFEEDEHICIGSAVTDGDGSYTGGDNGDIDISSLGRKGETGAYGDGAEGGAPFATAIGGEPDPNAVVDGSNGNYNGDGGSNGPDGIIDGDIGNHNGDGGSNGPDGIIDGGDGIDTNAPGDGY
ncbi:phenoloxidase-activating factor 2 [Lepeophtheirus salmonis]|uniref:phenoloxidase-activating factor 2 n=1 Tax=Lepeophtheirus salmonis TaxID=72036 RepID=UPI001AE111C6|nr:phenoloxidase-activating factor 2-like [Lepeophtheirus salmonis]